MARRRRPPRAGAIDDLNPVRLSRQIFALQASYYFFAIVLIIFTTLVAGKNFTLGLIFDWQSIRGDNTVGWTLGLCWILDSIIGSMLLFVLVSRSKLVPDFALTLHGIHFLIVSLYARAIPTNILWWLLQFASSAIMISLGIWACQWRELRPLSFGGHAGKAKTTAALGPHELGEDGAEIPGEGAFLRILSRVRRSTIGAEERGEYELAEIDERREEDG